METNEEYYGRKGVQDSGEILHWVSIAMVAVLVIVAMLHGVDRYICELPTWLVPPK